jgi:hypothetical protein
VRVASLAFSPDGRLLASAADRDAEVLLLDTRTGGERLSVRYGYINAVHTVAFTPDGRSIAAGCWDRTVRFHDVAAGKEWAHLGPHGPDLFQQRMSALHGVLGLALAPDGRSLATGAGDGLVRLWDIPVQPTERSPRLTTERLTTLWGDLAGDSDSTAHAAVWALARSPGDAVPFLRRRLQPVPAANEARLARLVDELDADRFAVRERASRALAEAGETAEPFLRRALEGEPSPELRLRARELLAKVRRAPLYPPLLRQFRAVEVLEHAGTDDAKAVMEVLAKGAAGAALTEDARSSLRRLQRARP